MAVTITSHGEDFFVNVKLKVMSEKVQNIKTWSVFVVCRYSLPSPPSHQRLRLKLSGNVSICRVSSLVQAVKVQTSAGNGISVPRWEDGAEPQFCTHFESHFSNIELQHLGSC